MVLLESHSNTKAGNAKYNMKNSAKKSCTKIHKFTTHIHLPKQVSPIDMSWVSASASRLPSCDGRLIGIHEAVLPSLMKLDSHSDMKGNSPLRSHT